METLGDIGELEAIERLVRLLPTRSDVVAGPGDDCAVVQCGGACDLLLTSDPVIEGTHFHPDTSAGAVGHKAVGRVLSDIAAMGGEPRWVLLDIVAPEDTPLERIEQLSGGAAALAHEFDVAVVGGDLSRGSIFQVHAFGVGVVPENAAVLRSRAQPGDKLFVTGELGGSRLTKHLAFMPRIREGLWLRDRASAMIDISDGLSTDLRHLLQSSRVGARLQTVRIPISADAASLDDGATALQHALTDGEDFELLFTVPAKDALELPASFQADCGLPCTLIGEITNQVGHFDCEDATGHAVSMEAKGYEHFNSSS